MITQNKIHLFFCSIVFPLLLHKASSNLVSQFPLTLQQPFKKYDKIYHPFFEIPLSFMFRITVLRRIGYVGPKI